MALKHTETIRNMRASVCRRELEALRTRRRRMRKPTEPGDDEARPTRRVQYSTRPNPHVIKGGRDD